MAGNRITGYFMNLCSAQDSVMVFLDIQERLIAVVEGNSTAKVVNNSSRLLQAAQLLGIPVLFTEQYSRRLGNTHRTLLDARPTDSTIVEKTSFSACDSEKFCNYLEKTGRKQIILCGLEAHVCVLQTAFALLDKGYSVFVVEDAVCARYDINKINGINRIQAAGAQITNRESVIFEWIRDSKHTKFREIVRNLIA